MAFQHAGAGLMIVSLRVSPLPTWPAPPLHLAGSREARTGILRNPRATLQRSIRHGSCIWEDAHEKQG